MVDTISARYNASEHQHRTLTLILTRGSMLYNRVPMGIASSDVAFNQDVRALTVDKTLNTSFMRWQLTAQEFRIPINETGIAAGKIDTDDLRA